MCVRVLVGLSVAVLAVMGMPQQYDTAGQGRQLQPEQQMPRNYNFQWNVDDEEYQNYYGHQEAAENDRIDGSYYVWLPDNRLMRVTYYVDGDSGFVPTITFEDNYSPSWGTPAFVRR